MYGMIHRGIRQMVIDQFGSDIWNEVTSKLETGPEHFISAQVYDDEQTVALLAAVAERLGTTMPECLKSFGRYWIQFAERGSYGAIMDFTGKDIATFIDNLDRMHQAVQVVMPDAKVPSFRLVASSVDELQVEYRSDRSGLGPFVIGLLEGLLVRFDLAGEVEEMVGQGNAPQFRIRLMTT